MGSNINLDYIINKIYKFDYSSLEKLDFNFILQNRVIPFDEDNYSIFFVGDNYNYNLISNIEYLLNKDINIKIISKEEIDYLLKIFEENIYKNKDKEIIKLFQEDINDDFKNKEVIDYLNDLISHCIENNITDLHIEPYENEIRVRCRLDGKLKIKDKLSKEIYSIIITRIKILAKLDISERRLPQDGRITFTSDNKQIDLRISFIPTINGEKITIRLLDSKNKFSNINSLGLSDTDLEYLKTEINKLNGMILVCGPTNSGKTTTIYSLLNEINREDLNIVTLEDPVEYKIYGINQIQINTKQGLNFNNTLRNILRADPEIISIGEIRDEETAETALRAAITGHFLLSTVHTKDSISTIFRLKDMNSENYLISSALNTIISQRLVRVLCNNCKKEGSEDYTEYSINKHYKPVGCPSCNEGYLGRTAVFEILKIDNDIRESINKNKSYNEILLIARKNGFKTLKENLINSVNLGITSFDEIVKLI